MFFSLSNVKRPAAALGIVAASMAGGEPQASAQYLSQVDIQNARSAVRAYGIGDWSAGGAAQRRIADPVVRKVVAWFAHTRLGSQSDFAAITRFIQDNPHWPWQKQLRRNAELAVRTTTDPSRIIAFYKGSPPYNFAGQKLAIDRLLAAGRKAAAVNLIRSTWASRYLRPGQSAEFRTRYGAHLRPEDHYNRLDYLLFAGHKRTARALSRQVTLTPSQQAAVRARLQMNLGRHYCGRRRGAYTCGDGDPVAGSLQPAPGRGLQFRHDALFLLRRSDPPRRRGDGDATVQAPVRRPLVAGAQQARARRHPDQAIPAGLRDRPRAPAVRGRSCTPMRNGSQASSPSASCATTGWPSSISAARSPVSKALGRVRRSCTGTAC